MDEITIEMDRAVAEGCTCLVLQDDEYKKLVKEAEKRNEIFGAITGHIVHHLRYHGAYVFPDSLTKHFIRS